MANMKPSVPDSPVKEAGSTSSLSGKKVTVEFLKTQDLVTLFETEPSSSPSRISCIGDAHIFTLYWLTK